MQRWIARIKMKHNHMHLPVGQNSSQPLVQDVVLQQLFFLSVTTISIMLTARSMIGAAPLLRGRLHRPLHNASTSVEPDDYLYAVLSQSPFLPKTAKQGHHQEELKHRIPIRKAQDDGNLFRVSTIDLIGRHVESYLDDKKKLWMLGLDVDDLDAVPGIEYECIGGESDDNTPPWVYPWEYDDPVHIIDADKKKADPALLSPKGDLMLPRSVVKEVWMAARVKASEGSDPKDWEVQQGVLTDCGTGVEKWVKDEIFASTAGLGYSG